ncbi:nuclear transport factor 2 family protein [Microbacterium sp. NPDC019599]|uniref:nuclear transport factor 2 family protein n=1 Tax=Microbacterium sp. NPDC019599 TaxID=3154690 RepID=UPI003403DF92
MSDVEVLRSLNALVAEWEQRRDETAVGRLDEILSGDLLFRRANGEVVDKTAFMASLSGPSPFADRTSDVLSVDVLGNAALVVVMVTTTDADGVASRFRNVRALTRTDDDWQIRFWFNERWREEPAPH